MVVLKAFTNNGNMDIVLINPLLQVVEECYLNKLINLYNGYLTVTKMDLIDHLLDR